MPVPLLDVNAQNAPLAAEFKAAFARVFESGRYILGDEVTAFEAEVAALMGTPHALGVSSGTDALLLSLMALDIGPRDEVIVPSFSFFASAGVISRSGATPVFADVCPYCFNLQPDDLEALITPRTKALMPVHLFGQAAEMDELQAIAQAHNLFVIEDAAQSLGARYRGQPLGSLGTCAATSFYPSKNLGGFGDSGLFCTSDTALYEKARALRVHGMQPRYHHSMIGGNFRMDPVQAALLRVKLPYLAKYNAQRAAHAAYYNTELAQLPGVALTDKDACGAAAWPAEPATHLLLPVAYSFNDHIWNQYTIRVRKAADGTNCRDALHAHLKSLEIGCDIYYPIPLHRQRCYATLPDSARALPISEQLADEVLSLPVYPELSRTQQDAVIAAIAAFLENKA
ncbi:MAG: DegT/DnrJ/EryC1/StrS family aminotransferase [Opitutales bacterium]